MSDDAQYDPEVTYYQVFCLGRGGGPITLTEDEGVRLADLLVSDSPEVEWFSTKTIHGHQVEIRLSSVQQIMRSEFVIRRAEFVWSEQNKAYWYAKEEDDKRLWRETMEKTQRLADLAAGEMDEGEGWKNRNDAGDRDD